MVESDLDDAVALLAVGFPERTRDYWRRGLLRLRDRPVPDDVPRYGYVLSDHGRLVGILLLLFTRTDAGTLRGNVSSWYVDPAYRGFSNMLLSAPQKLKDVTLYNISPAPATIETIAAQGFRPYVEGTCYALAALAPPVFGTRVRRVRAGDTSTLLADHAALGCLSFEVSHGGETFPFVFQPRRFAGDKITFAQLIYCREIRTFIRFAGPLGRRLLRHGLPAVLVDANAPLAGVPGLYRAGLGRKFFRGAVPPRLGDLSYSELVVFGP